MLKKLILSVACACFALSSYAQWNDRFPSITELTDAEGVAVINENEILLSGNFRPGIQQLGKVMRSVDGGRSFQSVLTIEDGNFNEIELENEVLFTSGVGPDSQIAFSRSTNYGDDWTTMFLPYTVGIHASQDFINDQVGVIATAAGTVIKTVDGGNSWEVIYQNTIQLSSIKMVDEDVIIMISNRLKVLKTVDGGENWIEVRNLNTDTNFSYRPKLEVTSETNFYIVSDQEFYGTEDGGITLNRVPFNDYRLNDIQFINGTIGYAVGTSSEGAGILKTVDGGITWDEEYNIGAASFLFNALDIRRGFIYTAGFGSFASVADLNGTPNVTALLSGYNEFCPGEPSELSMSFTGTPPWSVSYEFTGGNREDAIINTADTTIEIFSVEDAFFRWVSVTDGAGTNAFLAGNPRFVRDFSLDADFQIEKDTACVGDNYAISIDLSGCDPWEIVISNGTEEVIHSDINSNPFVFNVTADENTSYEILSVSDANREKEFVQPPAFDLLVEDASNTTFEESSVTACISESPGLVVNYSGLYFPWSYTYQMEGETITRENLYEARDTILLQTPGTYDVSLTAVTNECGDLTLDQTASVSLDGLIPPVIDEVIRHGFDSISVTWSYDFVETDTIYIERSVNGGAFAVLDTLVTALAYADTEVIDNATLAYRLAVRNSTSCISYSETVEVVTPLGFEEIVFDTLSSGHIQNSYQSAWIDLDGDGDEDITSRYLYFNEGGSSASARSESVRTGFHFVFTDFNNDGRWDRAGSGRLHMDYEDGRFQSESIYENMGAIAAGELDGDGLLDVVGSGTLGNYRGRYLFINESGSFGESTPIGSTDEYGYSFALLDYNQDNKTDIIVNDLYGVDIYENMGDGEFERNNDLRFGSGPITNHSLWADFNNDALLDVYAFTLYGSGKIHLNNGDGTYTEETLETERFLNGASTADYDNDGWLDIIVSSYSGSHQLFKNNGDGSFTKVAAFDNLLYNRGGFVYGHSITWGDFNEDGKQDVYIGRVINGVFLNNVAAGNWLQVAVKGNISNALGINSKIKVWATINGEPTVQYREVLSQNEGDQSSLVQHFGLGDATEIDSLEVLWPSGLVSKMKDVDVNQRLTIVEPDPEEAPVMNDVISASPYSPVAATLEWTDQDPTENGFVIERSLDEVNFEIVDTVARALTSYLDMGLSPSTTYYYRFYSFNKAGASGYSNVTAVTTYPPCTLEAVINSSQADALDIEFPVFTANTEENLEYQWLLNDELIDGATASSYAPNRQGSYSVVIRDEFNCIDTSNVLQVLPVMEAKTIADITLPHQAYLNGLHWIDINNDGLPDYFNHLGEYYIALGNGEYIKEPYGEGPPVLANEIHPADFNKDGILDYFTNSRAASISADRYCLIDQTGKFNCSILEPSEFFGSSIAGAMGDYDNDGEPELYIRTVGNIDVFVNWNGETFEGETKNRLQYGNDFNEPKDPEWIDIDNDLDLDLLLSNYINFNEDLTFDTRSYLELEVDDRIFASIVVDINNDGLRDVFLSDEDQNYMFLQNQDGTFTKNTTFGFLGTTHAGQILVWEDYDDDGDLDLFFRGYEVTDSLERFYYENKISAVNKGITVGLVGTVSNKMSIGARVYVTATIFGNRVTQMGEMDNKGSLRMHFGLGDADVIESIRVDWPSGQTITRTNVSTESAALEFTEPTPAGFCNIPAFEVTLDEKELTCEGRTLLRTNALFTGEMQWYRDGELIAGADSSELIVSELGNYSVRSTTEYCSASSASIFVGGYEDFQDSLLTVSRFSSCNGEGITLQAAEIPETAIHEWYLNGRKIPRELSSRLVAQTSGEYQLKINYFVLRCVVESEIVPLTISDYFVRLFARNGNRLVASANKIGLTYRWYRDGELLSGQTKDELIATSSGVYHVEGVDENGCVEESNEIEMIITDVEETTDFQGYPNPVTGTYYVPSRCQGNAIFEMINLLGEKVALPTVSWNDGVYEIDLSSVRPGLYILYEQCGSKQRLFKLLKQ